MQQTNALNLVVAENVGYRYDLAAGYWLEPLVGGRYTFSSYGANGSDLGLTDGHALRLQGGVRVGHTGTLANGYALSASFTTLLYSDVIVRGFVTSADGFSAGILAQDQNKLRVQSILSTKVDFANGVSAFLECQGRGGEDYWGVLGRVGARYQF